jgi:hypothetical protein
MHHKLSNECTPKRICYRVRDLSADERINQSRAYLTSLLFVLPTKYMRVRQSSFLELYSMQYWKKNKQ